MSRMVCAEDLSCDSNLWSLTFSGSFAGTDFCTGLLGLDFCCGFLLGWRSGVAAAWEWNFEF